jgi:hypothetical protein
VLAVLFAIFILVQRKPKLFAINKRKLFRWVLCSGQFISSNPV